MGRTLHITLAREAVDESVIADNVWCQLGLHGQLKHADGIRHVTCTRGAAHDGRVRDHVRKKACVQHFQKPPARLVAPIGSGTTLDDGGVRDLVGRQRGLAEIVEPMRCTHHIAVFRTTVDNSIEGDQIRFYSTLRHGIQPLGSLGCSTALGTTRDHRGVRHCIGLKASIQHSCEPQRSQGCVAPLRTRVNHAGVSDLIGCKIRLGNLLEPMLGRRCVARLCESIDDRIEAHQGWLQILFPHLLKLSHRLLWTAVPRASSDQRIVGDQRGLHRSGHHLRTPLDRPCNVTSLGEGVQDSIVRYPIWLPPCRQHHFKPRHCLLGV
mmetsp:Transcript_23639/g.66887  ORF Transcript_23639/g.66887 Transcript_23639/m.66887 type:complete len:323 (+) Transcript_23639:358-1326(+)